MHPWRMFKPITLCGFLVGALAQTSSAVVYLFEPSLTSGAVNFNDTTAGGTSTTVTAPIVVPNAGAWHTMNYPGYMSYTSASPHVDSASINVDITQTATGVPWFATTGSIAQAGIVNGDTAILAANMTSFFEGPMVGVNLAASLPLMAYNVTGVVGTNSAAFVTLFGQLDYYDNLGFFMSSVFWNYTNTTPGPFSFPVTPTLVGSPVLTDNLITVNGFYHLQADPSSISFAPVPEPASWAGALACGGLTFLRRRR